MESDREDFNTYIETCLMNKYDNATQEKHLRFEDVGNKFLPTKEIKVHSITPHGTSITICLSCGCMQTEHFNEPEASPHKRFFVELCSTHNLNNEI